MRRVLIPSIVTIIVLSACASRTPTETTDGTSKRSSPSPTSSQQRYQATALVLQRDSQSTMLCLGGILTSLPPQCGSVPITNWSWDRVDGEETASGSTWGEYHVVGTYDGSSFTVLDVGPPRHTTEDPRDEIEIPCQEPAGGWVASDRTRMSESDLRAAGSLAEDQPDASGWWIKHTEPPSDQGPDTLGDVVMNAAFTGDIQRHRQELSRVWGGPLCVVRYERTEAELKRVRAELMDQAESDFGIRVLFSDVDVVRNQVQMGVVAADGATQAAVDARYGDGAVRLIPALHPVE